MGTYRAIDGAAGGPVMATRRKQLAQDLVREWATRRNQPEEIQPMFTEKQVIALARSVRQAWEQADSLVASAHDPTAPGDSRDVRGEVERVRQALEDLQARVYALGVRARTEDPREAELRGLLNMPPDRAVLARLRELMEDPGLRDMARQIVASRIPGVRAGIDREVVADSVARSRRKTK